MKYYKHNSIPLETIDHLGIGERAFDEYGNYIEIDAFGDPEIVSRTVLGDDELIDKYENVQFLKGFWAWTNKKIEGYEVPDTIE